MCYMELFQDICAVASKAFIRDNNINNKRISFVLSATQGEAQSCVFSWELDKCFEGL